MNALGQSNFLQSLGWAVLNSLWQMAILWIIYQITVAVFRKSSPSFKSNLASGLLIGGFVWFVFTFISIYVSQNGSDALVGSGFSTMEGNQQLNEWMNKTLPLASLLYLILLVFPILHYIRNYRYVQVIRNHGLSKADVEWRMFVRRVTEQLGITKRVHIWISELVTSPVTIGYLKPVILIPMAAVNNLSANQMEAVLLHELAHIRRYDYFVNLILKFIQSILYFNPFVKSFISIVEREREKSCDEMVIQFQYDPHGYASALLALEKTNHLHKSLAVAASGRKNDLLHRIECIMGIRNKSVVSFNKLAGLMAGLLCIIGLNAVVILSKPTSSEHAVGSSFANISSPLYFFTDDFSPSTIIDAVAEMSSEETPATIITEPKAELPSKPAVKPKAKPVKPKIDMEAMAEKINYFTANPYAAAVAYIDQPEIPVLTEAEIKQVKGAVAASKKVITEGTWKQVENNIAEVLTQQQKKILETEYKKEMNKMDWKKLEKKLSMAYDKIDWDKINIELANAVNNIRLDSLNKVYSTALANLTLVEKELNNLNVTCIPDTDISLKTLDDKKKVVVQALHQLKTAKVKKVIHL